PEVEPAAGELEEGGRFTAEVDGRAWLLASLLTAPLKDLCYQATLHLQIRTGRQRHHVHRARALVGCYPLADPGEERPLVDYSTRVRLDGRDHDLAHALVGHPEDDGPRHGRVLEERPLDLGRVDGVAAGDDDVLGATREAEPPGLGPLAHHVAGAEPAVVEGRGGRLGRPPPKDTMEERSRSAAPASHRSRNMVGVPESMFTRWPSTMSSMARASKRSRTITVVPRTIEKRRAWWPEVLASGITMRARSGG